MTEHTGNLNLSPGQTRQLLEDYSEYRFRQPLDPAALAGKAGVPPQVVERLLQQQPVDEDALSRVAEALGISDKLVREVCGLDEMSAAMLETLHRFFAQALKPRTREQGAR